MSRTALVCRRQSRGRTPPASILSVPAGKLQFIPVGLALDDHGVAAEAVAALGVRVVCKRAHAAPGREDKTAQPEVPCPASFPPLASVLSSPIDK